MYQKLKLLWTNDLLFTAIIFCGVSVLSFWLGQQSVTVNQTSATRLGTMGTTNPGVALVSGALPTTAPATTESTSPPITTGEKAIVASKSGTKYHALSCPGAKQIKEENKIYFDTVAQAEAAGYTKASNCPSL
ncbi:MAG: hypothetical protein RLZZ70_398 [Candidatus Parcubacteria bacterium]|jgi:hypothetical protein